MAIDPLSEKTITLAEATRDPLLEVGGKRPHASTVFRWARYGLNGIRLEYVRVGRRIVTSREALARFLRALADEDRRTTTSVLTKPIPRRRSPKHRHDAVANAKRNLKRAGVPISTAGNRSKEPGPAD